MQSLAERTCVPCRGGTPPMGPEEIGQYQPHVLLWSVEENKRLRRIFRFKDFATALAFVDQIGAMAEEQGHHPDIYLAWGKVEVLVWTHKINGLTESDFIFAAKTDALARTAPGLKEAGAAVGSAAL